jgi:Uma2 family endonuclease
LTVGKEISVPHKPIAKWTQDDYERAADEYCASLPLEHFMEATPQSTQRKITVESLDLVTARRPDVQVFNELLVQYPLNDHVGQVVPDNMVVVCDTPIIAAGSFNLPFEPANPMWVLEYVSPNSKRKDYKENFQKYEQDLKVPYHLLFYPETQDLRLHHHNGMKYELLAPNANGRLAIPELEIEVALHDGWVRFWFQGELLPLPADLQDQVDKLGEQIDKLERQIEKEQGRSHRLKQQAEREKRRTQEAEAEIRQLRALVQQLQGQKRGGKKPREKS